MYQSNSYSYMYIVLFINKTNYTIIKTVEIPRIIKIIYFS